MQLTSFPAPSLNVIDRYGDIFDSLDAKEYATEDATTVRVRFPFGTDEHAFDTFVRDEIEGAKLVLESDAYARCLPPQFDADRAVMYLSKAAGVTGVEFRANTTGDGAPNVLSVRTSDEAAAAALRAVLVDTVELPGSNTSANIIIAPGEG